MNHSSSLHILIDQLFETQSLTDQEFQLLFNAYEDADLTEYLFLKARQRQQQYYGKQVFIRGLIEYTNHCKNDCYYCGIRASNRKADRYRLEPDTILEQCKLGYSLGFRTFVLQGGEDPYFSTERMVSLVSAIKKNHPDCAITLSIGEKDYQTYKAFKEAGADRYLLRHETFDATHYNCLHPKQLTAQNRQECLWMLKELGFQVGTGFMVGSPFQTTDHIIQDLQFIKKLQPQMIGIGPFIHHQDTPFHNYDSGSLSFTLFLIGILRLLIPNALIPATTALGTIHPAGRELGILSGANVVMPNLTPNAVKGSYLLYDNKLSTGAESADQLNILKAQMNHIGYQVVTARGDAVLI